MDNMNSTMNDPNAGTNETPTEDVRLCVIHHNVPGAMGKITSEVGQAGFNINEHVMRTNGLFGYQILDIQECELDNDDQTPAATDTQGCTGPPRTPRIPRSPNQKSRISELMERLEAMPLVKSCDLGRFPDGADLSLAPTTSIRLCVVNDNTPGLLGKISALVGERGINILGEVNKSNGPLAYNILDLEVQEGMDVEALRKSAAGLEGVHSAGIGDFAPGALSDISAPYQHQQHVGELMPVVFERDDSDGGTGSRSKRQLGQKAYSTDEHKTISPSTVYVSHPRTTGSPPSEVLFRPPVPPSGTELPLRSHSIGARGAQPSLSAIENEELRARDRATSETLPKSKSMLRPSLSSSSSSSSSDEKSKKNESYYGGSDDIVTGKSKERLEKLSVMRDRLKMTQDSQSLVIAMVGLPARGKSFTARKLERFLTWKNFSAKLFNAGQVRRDLYDPGESGASGFYDPTNTTGLSSRAKAAEECMDAMLHFLVHQNGKVAIFDATNSVESRRRRIIERCNGVANVVFVEVLCDDQEILEENILVKVRTSPDFRGMGLDEAVADMRERVRMYEKAYEPIVDDSLSYIKLFNLSSKILCNRVYGRITKSILPYMLALHIGGRPIYIARAGLGEGSKTTETSRNPSTISKVAPLSKEGRAFAANLAAWVRTAVWTSTAGDPEVPAYRERPSTQHNAGGGFGIQAYPTHTPLMDGSRRASSQTSLKSLDTQDTSVPPIKMLVSTLPRADETTSHFDDRDGTRELVTMLNPLDKGTMVGQSMNTIKREHPMFFNKWAKDPFNVRFPGGESYYDLMIRLESVVIEIEQATSPVLIVSHISCLQVLLAYFLGKPITEAMDIEVPMHHVIELVPVIGGAWKEKWHELDYMSQTSSSCDHDHHGSRSASGTV